jgi:methylenetetrahydrofolate reductase (NADPH)
MKVIDKIQKAEQEGRVYWSFEYFPPKTAQVTDKERK